MSEDPLTTAERAIWEARPYALAGTAATAIEQGYGASSVELLLADYKLDHLIPVGSERPPFRMDGTPAGRAFAAQDYVVVPPAQNVTWELYLPLAVRGDRIGVLVVSLPDEPGPQVREELVTLAVTLSHLDWTGRPASTAVDPLSSPA